MGVELKITFDGDEPGLAQHRLSLASFGESLKLLLAALQRTASGIIASALDDPSYGGRGGKLAMDAKLLDLELATIEPGCATPTFVCTARPGPQMRLPGFDTLGERAMLRLLRDIDAERQGEPTNASARKYIESIPKGVRTQRYLAHADGRVIADVQFGTPTLATITAAPAKLLKLSGRIVGVDFEPDASYISLKTTSRTVRCAASVEQVERALPLRHGDVVAAVLDGQKASLVWIRGAAAELPAVPIDRTVEHIQSSWAETLRILAQ
jgi:hypothetical protein